MMLAAMDELRTWADLKRELDARPDITQAALARFMPIDPSQLSRSLKTEGQLTVDQARRFAAFLESHAATPPDEMSPAPQTGPRRDAPRNRLPVYGYAAASDGDRFVLNEGQILEWRELPMGVTVGPGEYFIVLPSGSSMEPRIIAGEPQVVRWNYPPARDKNVVVEFKDGTALIKSFKGWRDGRIWLEQFNPPKMIHFPEDQVKAVHAVVFGF